MPVVTVRIEGYRKDIPIFYCDTGGRGDPIFFFHGLTSSHRIFERIFIPSFKRLFWNHRGAHAKHYKKRERFIAIDFPGFGKSPPLDREVTVHLFAEIAYRVMKQLRIKRMYLIGSSMGGAIGLDFVINHPEMVRAAVIHGAPYVYPERFTRKVLEFFDEVNGEKTTSH